MEYATTSGLGFLLMMWICARWAHLVSKKMPDWIHKDWNHQATTFLVQKDDIMTPEKEVNTQLPLWKELALSQETIVEGDPAPDYRWWTPARAPHLKGSDHRFWWIPYIGPYLNKDYRGLWTEIWVVLLSAILLFSVEFMISVGQIQPLDMFRVAGGIILIAWLQSTSNVDNKTQFLPDAMTIPLIWLGLLWTVIQPGLITPRQAVEGAIIGYMLLWSLAKTFSLLRKKEGMGGGDMKLIAAIGAWVGPFGVLVTIGLSSLIALALALVLAIRKKQFQQFCLQ